MSIIFISFTNSNKLLISFLWASIFYLILLKSLIVNFNIDSVYNLNLNLYKDNFKLLKFFFEENKNNAYLPHNILCKYEDISLFSMYYDYYDLVFENYYYKLKLNLEKIKNKNKWQNLLNIIIKIIMKKQNNIVYKQLFMN